MVDDFFGSYSGGSDIFTDPASFDLGGIDNFVLPNESVLLDDYGNPIPNVLPIYTPPPPSDPALANPIYSDTGGPTNTTSYNSDGTVNPGGTAYSGDINSSSTNDPLPSGLTNSINQLLGSNFTGAELARMAAVAGGGIAGLMGAFKPNVNKVGYQGSIPKYDAVRNMVNAPPTRAQGYRPGQGGINYGGDVSFVPRGTGASATTAQPSQTINQAPAGVAGIMAGLTGMGGQMPQGGLPRATPQPQPRPATAQPVAQDDPFYQSAEFKAYQNDPSNMMGTMDMYDSPYFGRVSSGSAGRAMDAAYEKYKGIAPQQNQQLPAMFDQFNSSPIENRFAHGGLMGLARGRYLQGETDGMADKIPAKIGRNQPAALSHGEFVVPADVVSHLGNGNSDAGAKKLYSMMDKIRTARTGTKKQGKEINPDKFMPGGEVKRLNTGGSTSGVGAAVAAGVTGQEQAPNTFAGEYIGDMLGKTQALTNAPYQQYMGPLTAGESGLQSKVFGGLQNINFPSNFGQSFSSTGAYQPPNLNMGAYNTQPIGTGTRPRFDQNAINANPQGFADFQKGAAAQEAQYPGSTFLNQGSNGFGDFGGFGDGPPKQIPNTPDNLPGLNNLFNQNMQAMTGLKNQGPAQRQTYEDYLESQSMFHALPQSREQFEQSQNQIQKMRDQGMDMLGRGDMNEIMAGLGGKPGQMPQGGLAGLLGGGDQGQQMQPMPGQPGYEQYLANIKQGKIEAEERRKSRLTSGGELERQQAIQEYGYGQKPNAGIAGLPQQQPQQPQGIASQYMNPYLQSVLDPQMAELRRQNDITNMMSNAKMTSAGAFGGGRQAIMNAENNRNLMQEMNKTVGQGYATAFDKAQNQFNVEQGQGLGLANLMANQGTTQRGIESEGIAADKAAFEEARLNPYKMLQFQQSMLNGMPISATNYNIAQPSGLTSLAQGATTVNTLLKNLGLGTPEVPK